MIKPVGFIAIAAAVLLPGCVAQSVRGAREYPVSLEETSTRTTDEIVRCITTAWQPKFDSTLHYLPRETGASISVIQPAILLSLPLYLIQIDIDEADGRRRVRMHQLHEKGKAARRNVEEVRSCL